MLLARWASSTSSPALVLHSPPFSVSCRSLLIVSPSALSAAYASSRYCLAEAASSTLNAAQETSDLHSVTLSPFFGCR